MWRIKRRKGKRKWEFVHLDSIRDKALAGMDKEGWNR